VARGPWQVSSAWWSKQSASCWSGFSYRGCSRCLNCEKKKWRNAESEAPKAQRRTPKAWEWRPRRCRRGGEWAGVSPPQPNRESRGASGAPPAGSRSGAEPLPKMNLVHFVAARRTLIAIIRIIVSAVMDVETRDSHCKTRTAKMWPCLHTHTIYKGILSNDKPAICRMWSSARCQAQGGTPRRNASLAFHLERPQKFRYGVPPFQKVPVWRSGAFRLSLSTGCSSGPKCRQRN